jgi:hypothetical protein
VDNADLMLGTNEAHGRISVGHAACWTGTTGIRPPALDPAGRARHEPGRAAMMLDLDSSPCRDQSARGEGPLAGARVPRGRYAHDAVRSCSPWMKIGGGDCAPARVRQ